MVKMDLTAQWLAGDELKQDQFKFLYKVMKITYDCALKDAMIEKEPKVIDNVIPKLVAYHSLLKIKGINDVKMEERKKELEKAERDGKKVTFLEEEEKVHVSAED